MKQPAVKWLGPLGEKIVAPLVLPKLPGTGEEIVMPPPAGLVERLEKLELLRQHYGIRGDWSDVAGWIFLSLALASDTVPGFQVVYDDPLAPEVGLPIPAKGGHQGDGLLPDFSGARLLKFVEIARAAGMKSDAAVCEVMVRAGRPDLDDPKRPEAVQKPERDRLTNTLRRRLAKAKQDARKKADGLPQQ